MTQYLLTDEWHNDYVPMNDTIFTYWWMTEYLHTDEWNNIYILMNDTTFTYWWMTQHLQTDEWHNINVLMNDTIFTLINDTTFTSSKAQHPETPKWGSTKGMSWAYQVWARTFDYQQQLHANIHRTMSSYFWLSATVNANIHKTMSSHFWLSATVTCQYSQN